MCVFATHSSHWIKSLQATSIIYRMRAKWREVILLGWAFTHTPVASRSSCWLVGTGVCTASSPHDVSVLVKHNQTSIVAQNQVIETELPLRRTALPHHVFVSLALSTSIVKGELQTEAWCQFQRRRECAIFASTVVPIHVLLVLCVDFRRCPVVSSFSSCENLNWKTEISVTLLEHSIC